MDEFDALGFIEFYSTHGIVRKDKNDFIGIIISKKPNQINEWHCP